MSQPVEGDDKWFDLSFKGQRIWVHVPSKLYVVSGQCVWSLRRLMLSRLLPFCAEHCAVDCDYAVGAYSQTDCCKL